MFKNDFIAVKAAALQAGLFVSAALYSSVSACWFCTAHCWPRCSFLY